MKSLALDKYEDLVSVSSVLEQDNHGLKVLQTPDGIIIKLFRRKRFFSSALLKSYASRFVDNVQALKNVGISTVDVQDVFRCKPLKRFLVFYHPLPGQTLRKVLSDLSNTDELVEKFTVFYAQLHNKGVMFRSIHLGNVIVSDDLQSLGLIDVADMKVRSGSLAKRLRLRNFKHLTRYTVDRKSIRDFGAERFVDLYLRQSFLPVSDKREFLNLLVAQLEADQ